MSKVTQKNVKQQQNTTKQTMMIDIENFNIKNFAVKEFNYKDDKQKNSKQFMTYCNYNFGSKQTPVLGQLVFKTKPIKLVEYGIPPLSIEKDGQTIVFAKNDKEREYLKVPHDKEQESCNELFTLLQSIDDWVVSNKEQVFFGEFSQKAKEYKYSPIVKSPQTEQKENKKTYDYCKLKLNSDFNSGNLETHLYKLNNDGTPVEIEDVNTVTKLAEHITWNSTVQFVITCNKLWYAKTKLPGAENKQFGFSFKIQQILLVEQASGKAKNDFKTFAFSNDNAKTTVSKTNTKKLSNTVESENDSDNEKVAKQAKSLVVESESEEEEVAVKAKSSDNDSEKEEVKPNVESSDDESEEEVKPPPKNQSKKNSKKVESSADESEEEVKPPPKSSKKNSAKVESSDDESEEEVKPPPKSSKKNSKKVESSDDDSSDNESEEEVKPPPKSSKKQSKKK
jgi:hypothetical protein